MYYGYGLFETKGKEGKIIGYHVPRLYRWYGLRNWKRIFGVYRWFVTSEEDYINAVNTLHELAKKHDFAFRAGIRV